MAGRSRRDSLPSVHQGGDGRYRPKKLPLTSRIKSRPKTPAPTSSAHSSHLPQWIKHKKVSGKKKNVSKSATWTIEMEEFIQGPKSRNTNTSGRGHGDSGNQSRHQRKRRGGVRGKRGIASAAYSFRVAYAVGVSDEKGSVAHAVGAGSSDKNAGEPLQQQFFELVEQWAGGGGGGGGGGGPCMFGGGPGGGGGGTGGRGRGGGGGERRPSTRPSADGSTSETTTGYSMATLVRPLSSDFVISTAMFSAGGGVSVAATPAGGGQPQKGTSQNKGCGQTAGSGAGDSGQFMSFVSSYCSSPNAASGAPNSLAQLLPVFAPPLTKPSTSRPNSPARASSSPAPPPSSPSPSSPPSEQPIPLPPPPPRPPPTDPANQNITLGDVMGLETTQSSSPRSAGTRPESEPLVEKKPSPASIRGCHPRRRSTPTPTTPGKRISLVTGTTTQQHQEPSPARRHSASPSMHTSKRQMTNERSHAANRPLLTRRELHQAQNLLKFESTAPSMSLLSRIGRGYDAQPPPRLPTTLPSALPSSFIGMAHSTRQKSPTCNAPTKDQLKKSEIYNPQLALDAKSLLERPVLLSNMIVDSDDSLRPLPPLSINTKEETTDSLITEKTYKVNNTTAGKGMKERNEKFVIPKPKYSYQSEALHTDKITYPSSWTETTAIRLKKMKESLKPSVNTISTHALTKKSSSSSKLKDQMLPKNKPVLFPLFQRSLSSSSLSFNATSMTSKKKLSSTSMLESYSTRIKTYVHENPIRKSFVQATNKKKSRESSKTKKQPFVAEQIQPSTLECEKMLNRNTMLKETITSAPEKNEMPKQTLNMLPINPNDEISKEVSEVVDMRQQAGDLTSKEVTSPVKKGPQFLEGQNTASAKRKDNQKQLFLSVKCEDGASESPKQSMYEERSGLSVKKSESGASVSQSLKPKFTSEIISIPITLLPATIEVVASTSHIVLSPAPSQHTSNGSLSVKSTKSCLLIPLDIEEPGVCARGADIDYNVNSRLSKDSLSSDTEKKLSEVEKTYLVSETKVCHFSNANEYTNMCSETLRSEDTTEISTSTETLKEFCDKEEKFTDEKLVHSMSSKSIENETSTFKSKTIGENACTNNTINFPELQKIHDSLQNMTQFLSRRVEEVVSAVSLSPFGTRVANHSISLLQRTVNDSVSGDKSRSLSSGTSLFSPSFISASDQKDSLPMKENEALSQEMQQDNQCIPTADLEMSSLMVANMIGLLSDTISELTGIPIRMASEMIKAGSNMRRRLEAVKAKSDQCSDTPEEEEEVSRFSGEQQEAVEGIRNQKSAQRYLKTDKVRSEKEHRKLSESIEKHGKHDSFKHKNTERHKKHAGSPGKRTSHRREKVSKASKKSDCAANKGVMTDEIQEVDKDVACHGNKSIAEKVKITGEVQANFMERERENISSELRNEKKWKEDDSTQFYEQGLEQQITHKAKTYSKNLKCSNEKSEEKSNISQGCDITKETESEKNPTSPNNIVQHSQKGCLFTQECSVEKEPKTSELNIENARDENHLKTKRKSLNTEELHAPIIHLNQSKGDGDGRNLILNPNKNNKPDKTPTKGNGDIQNDYGVYHQTGEDGENNSTVPTTNYNELDESCFKCDDVLLKQLNESDHMKHDGMDLDEQLTNNDKIQVSSTRFKEGLLKALLVASQTEVSQGKENTKISFSNGENYLSENLKEEHIFHEGPITSIKCEQYTGITSTQRNITRNETYSTPSKSSDENLIKHHATKDLKNKDTLQDIRVIDGELRGKEVAFHFYPSLNRTHCIAPERNVSFDSSALGYRVPRKRTRVDRATTPTFDNVVHFSISEKLKSPSSDATSETSSSCSAGTVREVVPKTTPLDQSSNEITSQANMINVSNKNCDESKVIKNNVTPDILLAPHKKVYETPPPLTPPHISTRPKSILTIPVEAVESFGENSVVICDEKNTETCHDHPMKQFPMVSKQKRKRLEFQKVPIRARKRTKIPDSWNPLKLNIPTGLKFNVFQTCEVENSLLEETSNNIDTPKPEFEFSFTNAHSILSTREQKDIEHVHETSEGETSDNDRKIDFLVIEPPVRDVERKVYRPILVSSKERRECSAFRWAANKRCSSPVHDGSVEFSDPTVQKHICDPESELVTHSNELKGKIHVTRGKNGNNFDNDTKSQSCKESYTNKYPVPSIVAASSICFSHTKNQEIKGALSQNIYGKCEYTNARSSSAFVRGALGDHRKGSSVRNNESEDKLLPLRNITMSMDNITLKQSDSFALKDGSFFAADIDVGRGKPTTNGKDEIYVLNDENKENLFTSKKTSKEVTSQNTAFSNGFPFQQMKEVKSSLDFSMNESLSKGPGMNKVSSETSGNILENSIHKNKWIIFDDPKTQKPRCSLVRRQRLLEHQSTECFPGNQGSSEESLQQFNSPRKKLHATSTHSLFENKKREDSEKRILRHRFKEAEQIEDLDPENTVKLDWNQAFDKYRSFQKSAQTGSERDKNFFTKSISEISFQRNSDLEFPDPFEYSVIPNPLNIPDYTDTLKLDVDNKVNVGLSKSSIHTLPNKGKNENTKLLGGNKQKRLTSATKAVFQMVKEDDRKTELRKRKFALSPQSNHSRHWTMHLDNSPRPKFPFPKPNRKEDKNVKECTWIVGGRNSTTDCKLGNFGSLKNSNYRLNAIKNGPCISSRPRNNAMRMKSSRSNKPFQEKVASMNEMNQMAIEMKHQEGETHAFLVRVKNAYSEEPKISLEHISSSKHKCKKRPDGSPTAFLTSPKSTSGGLWKELEAEARDSTVRNISVTCLPQISLTTLENTLQSDRKSSLFSLSRCEKKSSVQEARGDAVASTQQHPRRRSITHVERSPPRNPSTPQSQAATATPTPPHTTPPHVANAATSVSRSLMHLPRGKKEMDPRPGSKDHAGPCRRSGVVWGRRWCKQRREGEGGDGGEREGGCGAGAAAAAGEGAPQRLAFCDSAGDLAGRKTPRVDQRLKEAVAASRKRTWRPGSHARRRGIDAACALRECKYLCSLAAVLDRLAAVYRETDEPVEDMEMDECPTEDEVTWDSSGCGVQLRQPSTVSPMLPDTAKHGVPGSAGARAHHGRDRTRGSRPSSTRHHSRIPVLARQQPYLPQYPNDSWCFGLSE